MSYSTIVNSFTVCESYDSLIHGKIEVYVGDVWKNSKESVEVIAVGKIKLDNLLGIEMPEDVDGVVFKSGDKLHTVSTEFFTYVFEKVK